MAAPIVGDGTHAMGSQPIDLQGPDCRVQRPAVDQYHGLARAAVDQSKPLLVAGHDDARSGGRGGGQKGAGGERGEQGASVHESPPRLSRQRCLRATAMSMTWQVMT